MRKLLSITLLLPIVMGCGKKTMEGATDYSNTFTRTVNTRAPSSPSATDTSPTSPSPSSLHKTPSSCPTTHFLTPPPIDPYARPSPLSPLIHARRLNRRIPYLRAHGKIPSPSPSIQ